MKQSIYNYLTTRGEENVLYNVASDKFLIINAQLAELLKNNAAEEIARVHPQFFQALCKYGFLVDETADEHADLLSQWEVEDNDDSKFSLTINPTLKCNLRCWYCYEDHENPPADMSEETLGAVESFIESIISRPNLKHFHLSFFGGEPFLRFNQIVAPLIEFSCKLCKQNEKTITIGFTTNGVLISDKFISKLASFQVPISFQITLDGNKVFHNNTRVGKNKVGTYNAIIDNIRKLAEVHGVSILLRCNYTAVNLQSFADVATDLRDFTEEQKQNISVNFERIWQDKGTSDTVIPETLEWVLQKFSAAGFDVSNNDYVIKHRCYADSNQALVINSDGKLFRCTARDFVDENSEGTLAADGFLNWNERYHTRLKAKGGSQTCKTCIIFPICGAGCSQNRLERLNQNGCLKDLTGETIRGILDKRVDTLIDIALKHKNQPNQSGRE